LKKKIVVTGGLGFIGSKLIKKLKKQYKIIVLDNFYTSSVKKIDGVSIIKCDLTNKNSLKKIKIKNVYSVIHLAGQSSGPKSFKIPEIDLKLNLLGTINIINFCKSNNIKKIIFSSTFTVYGDIKNKEKLSEKEKCDPKSFYAISKYASEKYLTQLCYKYKIKWKILRFFNVYGPGQDLSRNDQGLVSIFLDLIRNNNKIFVQGSLNRFRDLIHVDDVVDSIILSTRDKNHPNEIYNIGTGKKTTIKELIKKISKLYKKEKKLKISFSKPTPGDLLGCYANIDKAKKHLGFEPSIELNKGLKLFKDWAESNFYSR
jgi:UDP-glucose 4-epimerase